jgi:hypothetical protein
VVTKTSPYLTFLLCLFTKHSLVVSFPPPCCSPSSSSSHFAWCFPCVSFSVWSSFLVACLGNPTFLVGVRMVSFIPCHSSQGSGKPQNFIQGLLTSSLCMGGLANLGLQVISKKLSGDQDLSLFDNFVVFLPSSPLWFHFLPPCCSPLSSSSHSTWCFPCVFI